MEQIVVALLIHLSNLHPDLITQSAPLLVALNGDESCQSNKYRVQYLTNFDALLDVVRVRKKLVQAKQVSFLLRELPPLLAQLRQLNEFFTGHDLHLRGPTGLTLRLWRGCQPDGQNAQDLLHDLFLVVHLLQIQLELQVRPLALLAPLAAVPIVCAGVPGLALMAAVLLLLALGGHPTAAVAFGAVVAEAVQTLLPAEVVGAGLLLARPGLQMVRVEYHLLHPLFDFRFLVVAREAVVVVQRNSFFVRTVLLVV